MRFQIFSYYEDLSNSLEGIWEDLIITEKLKSHFFLQAGVLSQKKSLQVKFHHCGSSALVKLFSYMFSR